MARYDHLPIWRDAMRLATLLEQTVQRFGKTPSPPRYHKYALGADLRRQAYALCQGVVGIAPFAAAAAHTEAMQPL